MKIDKRTGLATVAATMILWTIACGTAANPQEPLELAPRESPTILETPAPQNADGKRPESADWSISQTNDTTNQTATILPTVDSPSMRATTAPSAPNTAEPTDRNRDGQVYVAPKQVPTETPQPTPQPTPDLRAEPPTVWNQFTREQYEALIPDPALGVSWGHQFDQHEDLPFNTTPDGIRQNFDTTHPPFEMMHTLADKMLDGITGTEELFGEWNFYKTGYRIKRAAAQWEWIHPEIPLARIIIEGEFYKEGTILNPEIVVWRGGAHFIMKDIHTPPPAQGQVWSTKYEPELIGPVVVEETTCEGMLMPYKRSTRSGARCSP